MIAPAAMFVEIAVDQLKDANYRQQHAWLWPDQLKEAQSALPDKTPEFFEGYELGLQVARVLLAGMPAAVLNKVEI